MNPQLALQFSHALRYSSDSFLVHQGVQGVVDTVMLLARESRSSMVYVSGGESSGKTHLGVYLTAALRACDVRARFLAAEEASAWLNGESERHALEFGECVVIDDADLFIARHGESGIISDLTERVRQVHGLLVMLGGRSIPELKASGQVKSRLEAGIVLFIDAPAENDLDKLLASIARQRGVRLTQSKRSFILRRVARTLPSLVEYVNRLGDVGRQAYLSTSFGVLSEAASEPGARPLEAA